ncbi:IclR family transcriptional regulator [Lentzea sp. E54]|uniref:IclR family transcriptional regulator n=1 Tax=Lentzea xerophila TaxID=3435883 RepID=UPI003DA22B4A
MFEQLEIERSRSTVLQAVDGADGPRDARGAATKVLAVLEAFGAYDGPASLAELARHTGLPKSTTHRMVGFLRSAGLVDMADGRFMLTSRVAELSAAVPTDFSRGVREVLLPVLTELYEATHEAVHLTVRCGDVARVVERVHGRRSAGLVTQFRGALPLHCTAAGKILLAGSDGPDTGMPALDAYTPATITSGQRFREELANVRRYCVAFDRGEWSSGITGVAAPVWGPGRRLMGAVSVVGPFGRLMPDAVAPKVRKVAEIASRELHTVRFLSKQDVAS